jgi:hypothetical protein
LNMQFFVKKISFSVSALIAKIIGDYFDNRQYGANRTFLSPNCFIIHAANSVRIAINAGCFDASIKWHIDNSSHSSFSCGYGFPFNPVI